LLRSAARALDFDGGALLALGRRHLGPRLCRPIPRPTLAASAARRWRPAALAAVPRRGF